MQRDLSELMNPVLEIGREAGRVIMDVYGTEFSVDIKEDRSPLTTRHSRPTKTATRLARPVRRR